MDCKVVVCGNPLSLAIIVQALNPIIQILIEMLGLAVDI